MSTSSASKLSLTGRDRTGWPLLLDRIRAQLSGQRRIGMEGLFWAVSAQFSGILIRLASNLALTRLLAPESFALLGTAMAVITTSHADWERLDERLKSRLLDASICTLVDIDVPTYRGVAKPARVRRTTRRRL